MARIAIVGAGIIGAAIATWLIGEGHETSLFEDDPKGLPTSSGNAALIALPEIAPIASPGIFASVPGWLLDPLGPLTVRWTDVPALAPWLMAFLASATPSRDAASRQALTYLMKSALQDHEMLARTAGLQGHLRQTGYISIYDSEQGVKAALHEASLAKVALGYDFEQVSTEQARKMVPQLEGPFAGAVHQPVYWMVSNPLDVLRHYQDFAASKGRMITERVTAVAPKDAGVEVVTRSGKTEMFDRVVVSAGVWSRDLVRGMGVKVLLENERGYNTTFTDLGWNLPMPVGFGNHGFIASPLVNGLRVGGAVELAKPDTSPNFGRAKAMRTKMRRYVPALPEGGTEWMGRRPSTPDSVPVISAHPGDNRVLFAFGHGHLGLTLSAVTARLIAGLVAERPADAQLKSFDIARFQ